jgi:hypothetical protein
VQGNAECFYSIILYEPAAACQRFFILLCKYPTLAAACLCCEYKRAVLYACAALKWLNLPDDLAGDGPKNMHRCKTKQVRLYLFLQHIDKDLAKKYNISVLRKRTHNRLKPKQIWPEAKPLSHAEKPARAVF